MGCKITHAHTLTGNEKKNRLSFCISSAFLYFCHQIDDKELYLIGASLKDLGSKCFAFTKLDPADIRRIKKTAFHPAP